MRSPDHVNAPACLTSVALYQNGVFVWSYTNIVANITEPRCTNWMPQPDSVGFHQRSLWSVVTDVDQAGNDRQQTATSKDANKRRTVFMGYSASGLYATYLRLDRK